MIPVRFIEANCVLAENQEEYEPIAVHVSRDQCVTMTCCFRLSDEEIAEMVKTRTLWIRQLTFGRPFQAIGLSTQKPEMK